MKREARRDLDSFRVKRYADKPRPVLVVQDDRSDATESITVCPLTSDPTRSRCYGSACIPHQQADRTPF